jgi:hypothetical protein
MILILRWIKDTSTAVSILKDLGAWSLKLLTSVRPHPLLNQKATTYGRILIAIVNMMNTDFAMLIQFVKYQRLFVDVSIPHVKRMKITSNILVLVRSTRIVSTFSSSGRSALH